MHVGIDLGTTNSVAATFDGGVGGVAGPAPRRPAAGGAVRTAAVATAWHAGLRMAACNWPVILEQRYGPA